MLSNSNDSNDHSMVNEVVEIQNNSIYSELSELCTKDNHYYFMLHYFKEKEWLKTSPLTSSQQKVIRSNIKKFRYCSDDKLFPIQQEVTIEKVVKINKSEGRILKSFADLDSIIQEAEVVSEKQKEQTWKYYLSQQAMEKLIDTYHKQYNHLSRDKLRECLHKSKFYRTGMVSLCDNYFKNGGSCATCARMNKQGCKEPVTPIVSTYPFEHIQADYTFPLGRDDYCLATFKDHFSRKCWVFTSKNKTQANIIACLEQICKEVDRYPSIFQSDNGAEFGADVENFCSEHNITFVKSRPYHPRAQGSIERFNGTFKKQLFAKVYLLGQDDSQWRKHVISCLEEYNNSTHSVTRMTPNEAFKKCSVIPNVSTPEEVAAAAVFIKEVINKNEKRANTDAKRRNEAVKTFFCGAVVWVDVSPNKITKKSEQTIKKRTRLAQIVEFSGTYFYTIRWLSKQGFQREGQNQKHRRLLKPNYFRLVPEKEYDDEHITAEVGMPLKDFLIQQPLDSWSGVSLTQCNYGYEENELVMFMAPNIASPIGMGTFNRAKSPDEIEVTLTQKFMKGCWLDKYEAQSIVKCKLSDIKPADPSKPVPSIGNTMSDESEEDMSHNDIHSEIIHDQIPDDSSKYPAQSLNNVEKEPESSLGKRANPEQEVEPVPKKQRRQRRKKLVISQD